MEVSKDRLVKEPRHTPTWLPYTSGCMGLEGREEPRWWLITALVPVKAAVEKCRQARDLELYVKIEFKMISGGPCRLKKMGDIYADKKQVNKNWGKVERQADGQQGPYERAWSWSQSWNDS